MAWTNLARPRGRHAFTLRLKVKCQGHAVIKCDTGVETGRCECLDLVDGWHMYHRPGIVRQRSRQTAGSLFNPTACRLMIVRLEYSLPYGALNNNITSALLTEYNELWQTGVRSRTGQPAYPGMYGTYGRMGLGGASPPPQKKNRVCQFYFIRRCIAWNYWYFCVKCTKMHYFTQNT